MFTFEKDIFFLDEPDAFVTLRREYSGRFED